MGTRTATAAVLQLATGALLLLLLSRSASSDPDPLQDFCIPEPASPAQRCKDPATATAGDFVFSGIRSPGNFSSDTGLAAVSVTASAFPGLNTLGMSFVRADLAPGGVNTPHYHPRATEVALVVEGRVYSGFVDSGNRVFARVMEKGEVAVFPRGMLHFQMNVGKTPATIFGTFDSQNPGLVRIPGAVFGSGIREGLLEKAFGLNREEIGRLRRRFGPPKQ
ncbi:hypothetical protein Taro_055750 [Colocasia esculenta]|uniref:Germin-like protein n=1 Tax=Colocasia esculenta TaxID=4460 RepID=A0A843XTU7_COLES|nr:hypothetical protein [Colocasia esculenta]